MELFRRRSLLKGAIFGPVLFSARRVGQLMPDLDRLDDREIHKILDPDNLSPSEREHFIEVDFPPQVTAGEPFKMTVSVPSHVMLLRHYIFSMRVYLDTALVTYTTVAPVWQLPRIIYTFTFDKGSRVDVVVDCSLHGLWGRALPIVVNPSGVFSAPLPPQPAVQSPQSTDSALAPPSTDSSIAP